MDIDVTTLTNVAPMKLQQRISDERAARVVDPARGAVNNRAHALNPMAPYDARKRSLEDRVAALERKVGMES